MADTPDRIESTVSDGKKRKNLCSASSSDDSFVSTPSPARKLTKTVTDKIDTNFCDTEASVMDVSEQLKKLSDSLESLSRRVSTLQTRDDAIEQMDSVRQDMDKFSTRLSELCTDIKDRVESVENRVSDFEDKCDKLIRAHDKMKKDNEQLKKDNEELWMRVLHCEKEQNDAEQYTRRWNLRLFNVEDQRDETEAQCINKVCKIFTDKVKVTTTPNDIECCHRLGGGGRGDADGAQGQRGNPKRAIIVRFKPGARGIRDQILKNRRVLKGQNVSIAEDLTKANSELLKVAYGNECCESSWSVNGKIFALLKNKVKVRVPFGCNVNDLLRMKMLMAPVPPPAPTQTNGGQGDSLEQNQGDLSSNGSEIINTNDEPMAKS